MPALLEPLDRALPPLRREVRALGEDQHGVAAGEPAAHRGDLDLGVAAARVHEAVRQPPPDHVDQRVQRQRLVHDDPRPPAVAAQQVVEHEQRVALARVDAEHDERPLLGQRGLGRLRAVHVTRTRAARSAVARERADEPAQHRVVRARGGRRGRRPTARRRPPRRRHVPSRRPGRSRAPRSGRRPPNSGESARRDGRQHGRGGDQRELERRARAARRRAGGRAGGVTAPARSSRYATDAACARSMLSPTSLDDPVAQRREVVVARRVRLAGRQHVDLDRRPAATRGRRGSGAGARSRTPRARPPTASAAAAAAGRRARRA